MTQTKVERIIDSYGLEGIGDELESRWLGEQGDRRSLRELAEYFNCQFLEAVLQQAGEQPVDGETENLYRLLTADDISTSGRTQAETRLARYGVDVETVKRDFVSHQAIHTYLTEIRGAELPTDASSPETAISNRREALLRLRNRLVAVAERSLDSLSQAGHLSDGDFDVTVGITVYCDDCGTTASINELFNQGGCDCPRTNQ